MGLRQALLNETSSPAVGLGVSGREQIEWAAERGHLGQVMAYLKSLPEEQWYHMAIESPALRPRRT